MYVYVYIYTHNVLSCSFYLNIWLMYVHTIYIYTLCDPHGATQECVHQAKEELVKLGLKPLDTAAARYKHSVSFVYLGLITMLINYVIDVDLSIVQCVDIG